MKRTMLADVWNRIDVKEDNECWEWIGKKNRGGYGVMCMDYKNRMVHRLVYADKIGPIPDGMCVCHTCDNPGCCNPSHMWIGTRGDNNTDRSRKGRTNYVVTLGERHGGSVLTWEQVDAIRNERRVSSRKLAAKYNVSHTTIQKVQRGETWNYERNVVKTKEGYVLCQSAAAS